MSKEEQFEHIENKIRQAIEDNPPAFNEKAWVKMEALLDKEEKKRRPFFWWFLLPLLIAGGSYVFYSHNNKLATVPKDISSSSDVKRSLKEAEHSAPGEEQNTTVENILPGNQNKSNNSVSSSSNKPGSGNLKEANNKRNENVTLNVAGNAGNKNTVHNNSKIIINKTGKKKVMVADNSPVDDATMPGVHENDQATTGTDLKEDAIPELAKVKKENQDSGLVAISNKQKTATNANTPEKNVSTHTQKKSSRIYFLASVGPDIGSVKLFSFNNSSVAVKYGVGAGYQLNKKLSFQTGFYAGLKKYVAGPDDYHSKYNTDPAYKLISVNANCMVYEIPLVVRYDFLHKASISYYASLGLSSYLMKKEDYNYYYTNYNVPGEKFYSYTGNKHLFSTLSIAAGIEKKISSSLSLQVEPSVGIPLSGVGQGKVKLYSTAIMLGVKYYPFKK